MDRDTVEGLFEPRRAVEALEELGSRDPALAARLPEHTAEDDLDAGVDALDRIVGDLDQLHVLGGVGVVCVLGTVLLVPDLQSLDRRRLSPGWSIGHRVVQYAPRAVALRHHGDELLPLPLVLCRVHRQPKPVGADERARVEEDREGTDPGRREVTDVIVERAEPPGVVGGFDQCPVGDQADRADPAPCHALYVGVGVRGHPPCGTRPKNPGGALAVAGPRGAQRPNKSSPTRAVTANARRISPLVWSGCRDCAAPAMHRSR